MIYSYYNPISHHQLIFLSVYVSSDKLQITQTQSVSQSVCLVSTLNMISKPDGRVTNCNCIDYLDINLVSCHGCSNNTDPGSQISFSFRSKALASLVNISAGTQKCQSVSHFSHRVCCLCQTRFSSSSSPTSSQAETSSTAVRPLGGSESSPRTRVW